MTITLGNSAKIASGNAGYEILPHYKKISIELKDGF